MVVVVVGCRVYHLGGWVVEDASRLDSRLVIMDWLVRAIVVFTCDETPEVGR